jgi:outer membrane phospholipase A
VEAAVEPAAGGAVTLGPRSFRKYTLRGPLPAGLRGPVTARLPGVAAEPVMFQVAGAAPAAEAAGEARPARAASPAREEQIHKNSPEWASFFDRFSPNDPMYFSVGGGDEFSARFQLSMKYRVILPNSPLAERNPWIADFYLAYTQTSLWDLESESKPFVDTSYQPALIYNEDAYAWTPDWAERVGLRAGFQHESNGEDDEGPTDDSRSLNRIFFRPRVTFGSLTNWHVNVAPMVFFYVGETEGEDLPDYRGYFELYADFTRAFDLKVAATWRVGTALDRGSVQVDVSYPLNRFWTPRDRHGLVEDRGLGSFLHLQYFVGHGETLLTYDEWASSRIYVGLMLVR